MKKIVMVIMAVLLLIGCSSTKYNYEEEYSYDNNQISYESSSPNKNTLTQNDFNANRKQILYVNLSMDTQEFDKCIEALLETTKSLNGYVQKGNWQNDVKGNRYAEYVLRIPTEKIENLIEEISLYGTMKSRTDYIDDITENYTDVETHIDMLEVEYNRLLDLMKKAETVEDILTIEARLTDIRYQLESYKSIKQNYDLQLSYSTINIYLNEVISEIKTPTTIWENIQIKFQNSVTTIIGVFQTSLVFIFGNILYFIIMLILGTIVYQLFKHKIMK